jgi:methionine-S-sulfoxide reductase
MSLMKRYWSIAGVCGFALAAGAGCGEQPAAARVDPKPTPTKLGDNAVTVKTDKATFAAGCFWGVELEFSQIPGVVKTTVGYTGGSTQDPSYKEVCTDRTGHAEAVLIEFDPSKVSYEKLVDAFFELHDPTQVNRQGPDVGTQYRTAIFYHSPDQKKVAEAVKERIAKSGQFKKPVATQVVPAVAFYAAEDYHQQYFAKRGITRSCHTGG